MFLLVPGVLCLVLFLSGCATAPKASVSPVDQKFQAVAVDVYQNPESRSAAEKILGVNADDKPVVKYSPVTGKHYSGDLEFDPETGARLEVVKE
jgi:PBP1b-binding outer membrane lipoprotein LpoB